MLKTWLKRAALLAITLLIVAAIGAGYLVYLLTARVPGEYFDSNGVQIHYTVDGEGEEAVILVHGLAAQADLNWRRAGVTGLLADNFKVVQFDLRGHGLSHKPEDPDAYGAEMSEDVGRLMDHLGIEKAHIAGYSLGGFITLKFATDHPERVISAAYCASGWKDPKDPADIRSPYRSPDYPDTYKDTDEMKKKMEQAPKALEASVLDFSFLKTPVDYVKDYVGDSIMPRPVRKALKESYLGLVVSQEELENCKTPSICFIGTNDGLMPYATAMKEHLPTLELVVLDGADHITTAINGEFHSRLNAFFMEHSEKGVGKNAQAAR